MRSIVTEMNLVDHNQANDGLARIKMTRLTPIVALAGPNGAGKTRLLKRLKQELDFIRSQHQTSEITKSTIKDITIQLEKKNLQNEQLLHFKRILEEQQHLLSRLEQLVVVTDRIRVIELSADVPILEDVGSANIKTLIHSGRAPFMTREFNEVGKNALRTLQQVANDWLSARQSENVLTEQERTVFENRFVSLNDFLSILLGESMCCKT